MSHAELTAAIKASLLLSPSKADRAFEAGTHKAPKP